MEGPGSSVANQINLENMKNNSKAYEPYMNGKKVFQNAVCRFPEVINEAMNKNDLSIDDIRLIIPHQANLRIIQSVAKSMNISMDKKNIQ